MDCKFQLFYTDITIDFDDYKDPIKPYINSLFVQLDPTLFLKMNAFFSNQYFENDNYLLFVFNEEEPTIHTLFSRYEEWSLYKGLDRGNSKPKDYNTYAKIYIRADTKKTTIKRKYQKIMEFYADSSSLLIALFEIIYFIFNYTNGFLAEHSLSKQLFFFKGIKSKNFNINKKSDEINKLINLTDPFCTLNSISNRRKNNVDTKLANKDINIYDIKKNEIKMDDKDDIVTDKDFISPKKYIKKKGKGMGRRRRQEINKKISVVNYDESNKNMQLYGKRSDITSGSNLNSGIVNNVYKSSSGNINNSLNNFEEEIKFTYNIFEIFMSQFLCCCLPKYLEKKRKLSEKANNLLNEKLDIALYLKNAFLLEIMNQSLVDDKKQGIIKFMSRPIISYKNEEKELSEFYQNYSEKDFEKFNYEIIELIQNPHLEKIDQKLISLSNKELKKMI